MKWKIYLGLLLMALGIALGAAANVFRLEIGTTAQGYGTGIALVLLFAGFAVLNRGLAKTTQVSGRITRILKREAYAPVTVPGGPSLETPNDPPTAYIGPSVEIELDSHPTPIEIKSSDLSLGQFWSVVWNLETGDRIELRFRYLPLTFRHQVLAFEKL